MSFLSYMRDQRSKVQSCDYINYIWDELQGKNTDNVNITSNSLAEYNNHLPVLLDQFWEVALEKLRECQRDLDEFDEDLKKYLLVLLYQCTTHTTNQEVASFASLLRASQVYLILLSTRYHEDFFRSKLYKSVISNLQNALETGGPEEELRGCIGALGVFVKGSKLQTADLEVTLAFLVQVVCIKSRKNCPDLEVEPPDGAPIDYKSLFCLKTMLQNENVSSRKFLITTYLFNGLRKFNTTPHLAIVQSNFRVIIRSSHLKFKEDRYKTFMNSFIHIWQHPDFCYYSEATNIINALKEKYQRELIQHLNTLLQSKCPHKNVFRLALAVICNPSKSSTVDKVTITNEILLRNILINCLSQRPEVSNHAVEALGEILTVPDLEKPYIKYAVHTLFNYVSGENVLNTTRILGGLRSLMNKKWSSKSKNKHLFAVTISVMFWCEKDYPVLYYEILELLTEEASPFDLKPYLHMLSETFLKMRERKYEASSFQLLKVIVKMALHPMASSTEFVKHIYMAMFHPNICKGTTPRSEMFIDPIISDAFNFNELFRKCHTLGLIKTDHVTGLMNNLHSLNESKMKLLCAVIHLTEYKDLTSITEYIKRDSSTVCNSENLKYLLFIYNTILHKAGAINSNRNLRCNDMMLAFLQQHLLQQTLRWDCVANAFALMQNLCAFANLPQDDFNRMKEEYDTKLIVSLRNRGSFLPVFYYAQLAVTCNLTPSPENIEAVKSFLTTCSQEQHLHTSDYNPKLWIGCLILFTNICLLKNNLLDAGFHILNQALMSRSVAVKMAAIDLTFDLCNLVSHNFVDLINYMFNQLTHEDVAFRKTCLVKIDRLIRDNYLKLDALQFVIFVAILGDRNYALADFLKHLMSESFFLSSTSVITKYFIHLIIYVNVYKDHPIYQMSVNKVIMMENMTRNISNRRKIFDTLLSILPVKSKFNIALNLSTNILEKLMKNELKLENGFWKMIKDSVHVFKSISMNESNDCTTFYKKIITKISQHVLHKSDYSEQRIYPEHQAEIIKCTRILIKLLFFNDSENVQKHIRIPVFDAIIHWTDFHFPDLVYLVHHERCKELKDSYTKVEQFYKQHAHSLRFTDECFESGTVNCHLDSTSLFSLQQGCNNSYME